MKIAGMGWLELLIILVVVLLIFGPKNLPKIGKSLGRTVKNVRDGIGGKDDKKGEVTEAEATVEEVEAGEEADGESAAAEPAAVEPEPEPEPAASAVWTCECGNQNTGKFCNECGKPAPQNA